MSKNFLSSYGVSQITRKDTVGETSLLIALNSRFVSQELIKRLQHHSAELSGTLLSEAAPVTVKIVSKALTDKNCHEIALSLIQAQVVRTRLQKIIRPLVASASLAILGSAAGSLLPILHAVMPVVIGVTALLVAALLACVLIGLSMICRLRSNLPLEVGDTVLSDIQKQCQVTVSNTVSMAPQQENIPGSNVDASEHSSGREHRVDGIAGSSHAPLKNPANINVQRAELSEESRVLNFFQERMGGDIQNKSLILCRPNESVIVDRLILEVSQEQINAIRVVLANGHCDQRSVMKAALESKKLSVKCCGSTIMKISHSGNGNLSEQDIQRISDVLLSGRVNKTRLSSSLSEQSIVSAPVSAPTSEVLLDSDELEARILSLEGTRDDVNYEEKADSAGEFVTVTFKDPNAARRLLRSLRDQIAAELNAGLSSDAVISRQLSSLNVRLDAISTEQKADLFFGTITRLFPKDNAVCSESALA